MFKQLKGQPVAISKLEGGVSVEWNDPKTGILYEARRFFESDSIVDLSREMLVSAYEVTGEMKAHLLSLGYDVSSLPSKLYCRHYYPYFASYEQQGGGSVTHYLQTLIISCMTASRTMLRDTARFIGEQRGLGLDFWYGSSFYHDSLYDDFNTDDSLEQIIEKSYTRESYEELFELACLTEDEFNAMYWREMMKKVRR